MKGLCIVLVLLCLTSCEQPEHSRESIRFTGTSLENTQRSLDYRAIDLDLLNSYTQLMDRAEDTACENEQPTLSFSLRDTIYNIPAFIDCPDDRIISCHFNRNILIVKNDSLINLVRTRNEFSSIENLNEELRFIISKPFNYSSRYSKMKPVLIHLYVEDQYPIITTKKVLSGIAKGFDEINRSYNTDYIKYHILLERTDLSNIPIPPPPPPPLYPFE